jgi:hypothetical protein
MLTGETPFKGIYPEAISYAIRNDPTPPLKAGSAASPSVEQLVLKTLRRIRRAVSDGTRTGARSQIASGPDGPVRPAHRTCVQFRARIRCQYQNVSLAPTGADWGCASCADRRRHVRWLFSRCRAFQSAVAPVINLTGDRELDGYRLALSETLVAELTESATVRVLPYRRLLEILRRFVAGESDVSSRDALQAIAAHSAATFIVVPTLVYENNAWRARAEFRSALRTRPMWRSTKPRPPSPL